MTYFLRAKIRNISLEEIKEIFSWRKDKKYFPRAKIRNITPEERYGIFSQRKDMKNFRLHLLGIIID